MISLRRVVACSVFSLLICSLNAGFCDDGFEYHAYLRSGVLESKNGGKGIPFQAPGAPAKYRLGNEAETYGEAILAKTFQPQGTSGVSAKAQTLLAYKTQNDNQWAADTDEFTIREAYAEFWNFDFADGMSLWAGNRYYRRFDIHINDFYWLDSSGYGGGAQDIPLGHDKLKLHFAYLRGSPDEAVDLEGVGLISKQVLDIRLAADAGEWGHFELFALPSYVRGGTYETKLERDEEERIITTKVDSERGIALGLIHMKEHSRGFNNAAVQWGKGVARDFGSSLWATPDSVTDQSSRLRLLDYGTLQATDSFAMMYAALWDRLDNGHSENNKSDWISVGLRPIYSFTRHFALAVEAGVDYTRQEGAAEDGGALSGTLAKLTLCPEVRMNPDFFARPVLRAFITVARWSDDFKGEVGGTPWRDKTSGMNFGVQMEAWF